MPDANKTYLPLKIRPLTADKLGKISALHSKSVAATKESTRLEAEAVRMAQLEVGAQMDDGSIYAGISPDTNERMYAVPADIEGDFNQAAKRAQELSQESGKVYRVPSEAEMEVLYSNCTAIGGFKETGIAENNDWYWSSTEYEGDTINLAKGMLFYDGRTTTLPKTCVYSVRLVRS